MVLLHDPDSHADRLCMRLLLQPGDQGNSNKNRKGDAPDKDLAQKNSENIEEKNAGARPLAEHDAALECTPNLCGNIRR